jgi:hypothetical protein
VDDERLEWALRRLPGVLACSLDGDSVTLLLDPHASVIDVEAAANALLLGAGDVRPPLLLGGTRPVMAPSRGRFDVMPVVKAAGPGLIAVGAAALVATLVASPASFWRDSVTPSGAPAALGAAPAPHRDLADVTGGLPDSVTGAAATPAAPVAPAPATDRRLVLLIPQLPAAPLQNIASVTHGAATDAIASGKAGITGGSVLSLDGAASTATSEAAVPNPSAKQRGGGRPRWDGETKHGGKHGEKDELGHGEKGWGQTRREQVRPQTARGTEHASSSAHRRGRDDD